MQKNNKDQPGTEAPAAAATADVATKADVANLADDLNAFKGSTDKSFASVWKAIDDLGKKSSSSSAADGGAAAGDHEHVPAGHAPWSDDRVTGPIADPDSKPKEEEPATAAST